MNHKVLLIVCLILICQIATHATSQDVEKSKQKSGSAERLSIGSEAPALDIKHWISVANGRRSEVKEFEPGQIYLLEFWGTWCGACIMKMPELVELQKKYLDRGVTIIGITDEEMEEVNPFLDKKCHHDESLTYRELTASYCLVADPDESVFDDYMRGVERRSFPTVAIIGKTGLIEYIGSANGLGSSLESIVNGTWNREARRNEQIANLASRKIMLEIHDLKTNDKIDEAIEVLDRQVEKADHGAADHQLPNANVNCPKKQNEARGLVVVGAKAHRRRWGKQAMAF